MRTVVDKDSELSGAGMSESKRNRLGGSPQHWGELPTIVVAVKDGTEME